MELYAIKDLKSNTYGRPSLEVNENVALRSCSTLVNDSNPTLVNQFPNDFELYKVADYDEKTGAVKPDLKFIKSLADLKMEAK